MATTTTTTTTTTSTQMPQIALGHLGKITIGETYIDKCDPAHFGEGGEIAPEVAARLASLKNIFLEVEVLLMKELGGYKAAGEALHRAVSYQGTKVSKVEEFTLPIDSLGLPKLFRQDGSLAIEGAVYQQPEGLYKIDGGKTIPRGVWFNTKQGKHEYSHATHQLRLAHYQAFELLKLVQGGKGLCEGQKRKASSRGAKGSSATKAALKNELESANQELDLTRLLLAISEKVEAITFAMASAGSKKELKDLQESYTALVNLRAKVRAGEELTAEELESLG